MKMLGSLAAFLGNLMIGELHEATGSYNVPMWLMAGLMGTAALLALCLSEPGTTSATFLLQTPQFDSRTQPCACPV